MGISYGVKQVDKRKSAGGCLRTPFLIIIVLLIASGSFYYYKFVKNEPNPVEEQPGALETDNGSDNAVVENDIVPENTTPETKPEKPSPVAGTAHKNPSESAPVEVNTDISPEKLAAYKDQLKKGQDAITDKDYIEAKKIAQDLLSKGIPESHPIWQQVVDVLNEANTTIFHNDIHTEKKKIYVIQSGDSLDKIAKKHNTTIPAIQKSNKLDPYNPVIHPGNQLWIYLGDWHIVVSKKKFRLYLYDGDKLFKVYNIAVGKDNRTPVGTFEIVQKQRNPDWVYHGKRYPFGSKENVLGTRWMRIKPTGDTNKLLQGYGIHGTWAPESIGTRASNGCIRMVNNDVEELYDIIPKYSKIDGKFVDVTITEE